MNIIKSLCISSIVSIISLPVFAVDIDLANGISIEAVNGQVYDESKTQIESGENQFVFEFSGDLNQGTKRKRYSARPYIVTLDLKDVQTLKVDLLSRRYRTIERNVDKKAAIFQFELDGKAVKDTQELLPPKHGAFPYADIPALVAKYNQDNGLAFDSGRVVELKEELTKIKQVKTPSNTNTVAKPSVKLAGANETENTLELKLWYLKASKEERKLFKRWMIEQD